MAVFSNNNNTVTNNQENDGVVISFAKIFAISTSAILFVWTASMIIKWYFKYFLNRGKTNA